VLFLGGWGTLVVLFFFGRFFFCFVTPYKKRLTDLRKWGRLLFFGVGFFFVFFF